MASLCLCLVVQNELNCFELIIVLDQRFPHLRYIFTNTLHLIQSHVKQAAVSVSTLFESLAHSKV